MTVAYEGQVLNQAKEEASNEQEMFDLDLQVSSGASGPEPLITSKFACTPGCGKTGSFNSFCC